MKSSALAYSNIALIKYWGKSDSNLRLPLNSSFSMNLSNLQSKTTVEFSPDFKSDEIVIDGKNNPSENRRVIKHLDRIRKIAKNSLSARVVSSNNFPASSGLSSSASGFAALTLAASQALNLNLSQKELSVLARLGSGSACRSIPGGFVQWQKGNKSQDSYAYTVSPPNYWDIVDLVVIVSEGKKIIPTSDAQKYVLSSPFINERLKRIEEKIKKLKQSISEKNFLDFGELIESECLELHAVFMTQTPSFIYLLPETLCLIHQVRKWRSEGLKVYFTVNTGHNVHLLCQEKDKDILQNKLSALSFIKKIILNYPAGAAKIINDHLF